MSLVVQKYGGSSVADGDKIKRVAQRIVDARRGGYDVVVVVSAMGDTTDELLDLAQQVSPLPTPRELDMLLTSGERISMALLAMAIANLGASARSFTGSQAGVITDSVHGRARIIDELRKRGFRTTGASREGGGLIYQNAETGERMRIMPRPTEDPYSNDEIEKRLTGYYYRYKPGQHAPEGRHSAIVDKPDFTPDK